MKLTYRGVQYDLIPTPVMVDDVYAEGKYRGVAVQYRRVRADVPQPAFDLTYRGVAYRAGEVPGVREVPVPATVSDAPIAPAEAETKKAAPVSIQERARLLMMNHHRKVMQRDQSMLMRLDREVGLDVEDATHFWNQIQGKVHSEAWATYDRSHAAMS